MRLRFEQQTRHQNKNTHNDEFVELYPQGGALQVFGKWHGHFFDTPTVTSLWCACAIRIASPKIIPESGVYNSSARSVHAKCSTSGWKKKTAYPDA